MGWKDSRDLKAIMKETFNLQTLCVVWKGPKCHDLSVIYTHAYAQNKCYYLMKYPHNITLIARQLLQGA